MLSAKNIYTDRPTKKIDYRFLSPFAITEKIGIRAFRLYLILIYQKLHSVFHVFLLKFYRRKAGVEPPFSPPIKIDREEKWEMKEILSVRIRYKKAEFKVQ
jgi:hypothetical protein